jgi:3-hydroxymyristoyl/3-hydroxydecanoyl-(acyl carrier protein) dehydratase
MKNVTASDDLMMTDGTGEMWLPSAMLLEAMAQAAGLLVAVTIDCKAQPVLAKVQPFTAYGQARAGDQIELYAELEELRAEGCRARTFAAIERCTLAEATIYLALMPLEDGAAGTRREQLRARLATIYPDWFYSEASEEVLV